MTRQQINAIIVDKLQMKIQDMPNAVDVISRSFNAWFRALLMPPVPMGGEQIDQGTGGES